MARVAIVYHVIRNIKWRTLVTDLHVAILKHYIWQRGYYGESPQVAEFSRITEDWEAYMEQLESYFVANNITTAAKKRVVLLSSCGTATYKIIRSVVAPEKPTKVSYANLTKKV